MQIQLTVTYDADGNYKLYDEDGDCVIEQDVGDSGCHVATVTFELHLPDPTAKVVTVAVPQQATARLAIVTIE